MADARLFDDYIETLGDGSPIAKLADSYTEALSSGTPSAKLADVYIEVLTPKNPTFVGWGIPFSVIALLFFTLLGLSVGKH